MLRIQLVMHCSALAVGRIEGRVASGGRRDVRCHPDGRETIVTLGSANGWDAAMGIRTQVSRSLSQSLDGWSGEIVTHNSARWRLTAVDQSVVVPPSGRRAVYAHRSRCREVAHAISSAAVRCPLLRRRSDNCH